ncbi:hypothetical protein BDP27DRAFT_1426198 [Rhodocollybia butyracea]|uniref:Uncharacterized protein n=1 Tax=Rhodocollybia butyracea TaxID=206335 RepID=A0A9P5PK53_9AGAR|nr:hypothetical protein BDP27DRAFT_1426198 [Rhodocollybia butyracea]
MSTPSIHLYRVPGHELLAQERLSEHSDVLPWYLLTYAGRGVEGVYLELEDADEAAKDYPNAEIQPFDSAEKLICEWSKYCEQSSWSDGRTGKSESSERSTSPLDEEQVIGILTERSTGLMVQARELKCNRDRDDPHSRMQIAKAYYANGGRCNQTYYAVATTSTTVISANEEDSLSRFTEWEDLGRSNDRNEEADGEDDRSSRMLTTPAVDNASVTVSEVSTELVSTATEVTRDVVSPSFVPNPRNPLFLPSSEASSTGGTLPCLKKTTNWSSYLHCLTPDDDLPNYSSSSGGYYFRQSETDYRHGTELGCSPPIVDTPTILVDSRTIPLANLS